MALDTMSIFKHLPAAKKTSDANCKKCGCPTCMAFALKLSKGNIEIEKCPNADCELIEKVKLSNKIQQKTVEFKGIKIGGEKVFSRHEKTFINKSAIFVTLQKGDKKRLQQILDFEIESVGEKFKIDGVIVEDNDLEYKDILEKNGFVVICYHDLDKLQKVDDTTLFDIKKKIDFIRYEAIKNRNEKYSDPIYMHFKTQDIFSLCAKASVAISRCVSLLVFDDFNEALFTSIMTLRQNIFTDPEKPLQVESKIYEFNNPDDGANVFLTTNFALTYFAVANELATIKNGSYLVITPSEGMSVLTAWSAEKITAKMAGKIVRESEELQNIRVKKIVLPGLLCDIKEELEEELPDWEIIIGPSEAYKLPEFVNKGY